MNDRESRTPLLSLKDIGKTYSLRSGLVARAMRREQSLDALDDVSIDIHRGDIVGIVGESGSGKSTLGRIIVRLLEPSRGTMSYRGSVVEMSGKRDIASYRRHVQMIFQDSGSALNPRKRIRRALHEALRAAGVARGACKSRIEGLLERTGLPPVILDRYPHALSGGQKQRVNIARALAMEPELLVADEPVSALDVSLQGQIINLLMKLAADTGLTLVFISHDLAVVRRICTHVVVMHSGRIVERGSPEQLMSDPQHPYTRKLIAAVPRGLAGRAKSTIGPC
jgi:peptide/nickel transport system ATP-binding protein